MTAEVFVDTNVLAYAYDRSEPAKQCQALAVLDVLAMRERGVLSTQVLGELFVTLTRKLTVPIGAAAATERIQHYLLSWPVLEVTGLIVLEAARGVQSHQLSFWDAQIWATARLNQIPVIFSEDFSTNRTLEGIQFINPFAASFRLEDWC
ncbi:MAG: PIN domain-containing protein [candidate division NC10 bacterium]|nr:PIN domain-containing protein [candidate division NC10 bacterium]MDE2321266.1 PIN domain-containing protein [candidate division NC10 bacterium]